uniref:F-box domain-containing protein n=1 Tax=Araucaria cunninghamii TaxID=56994 RepID=A0A0D6R728_ARACU
MESGMHLELDHGLEHERISGQCDQKSDFEANDASLIPGLPDDIAILCLARVPRKYHHTLKCVSKKWRDVLITESLYSYRQRLGIADSWIYALCRDSHECVHFYVLDPSRRRWKELPGLPTVCSRRFGMACEALGRRLYLLGGCGWSEDVTNEVYCYDPLINKWESVASMETARCHFVTEACNGRLYAIGGMGSTTGVLTSWETYDSETNKWASHEDPNVLPDIGESLTFDDRIYIRHISTSMMYLPNFAAAYDTSKDAWSIVDDEMTMNWYGPALVVGGNVYMVDQTSGIKLMMLDKVNRCWVFVGRLSPHLIRTPCRITAIGNMLYVIGRGLQTVMIDMEKMGKARGMLVTSSIAELHSLDDVVISCKTLSI